MNISDKIKLIRSIMWGYIFLLLIIVPMLVDHFITTPIPGKTGFDSTSWCILFVGIIIISLVTVGWAMKYVAYRSKGSPLTISFALYAFPSSLSGYCALLTILLILFDLEVFGVSSRLIIWICIFIFGSISVYGMRQADKLVERILKNQGGQQK